MKITYGDASPEAARTLEALRKAVQHKLDEKRRLGHYYVIWRDGGAVFIGEDAPTNSDERSADTSDNGAKA